MGPSGVAPVESPRLNGSTPHTQGVYLNLYEVLDLSSRYPIAWMISRKENAALAQHLFRHALQRYAIEPGDRVVHQDGGPR